MRKLGIFILIADIFGIFFLVRGIVISYSRAQTNDLIALTLLSILTFYILFISLSCIFYSEIFNWKIRKMQTRGIKIVLQISKKVRKTIPGRSYNTPIVSIVASGINPITGKKQDFKSSFMPTLFLKEKILNNLIGTNIDVYISENTPA